MVSATKLHVFPKHQHPIQMTTSFESWEQDRSDLRREMIQMKIVKWYFGHIGWEKLKFRSLFSMIIRNRSIARVAPTALLLHSGIV